MEHMLESNNHVYNFFLFCGIGFLHLVFSSFTEVAFFLS